MSDSKDAKNDKSRKIPRSNFTVQPEYIPPTALSMRTVVHPPRGPYYDPTGPDIELYKDRARKAVKNKDLSAINPRLGPGGKITITAPPGYEPTWRPGRDGEGGGGGNGEAGEDEGGLEFELEPAEFLKLFFPGLELPDLKHKDTASSEVMSVKRKGTQRTGPRARLDKHATAKNRIRRAAAAKHANPEKYPEPGIPTPDKVPYAREDLRFRKLDEKPLPDSKAVVFFILDRSGSTDGEPLEILKQAFFLFHLFLLAKYKKVVVVMIGHDSEAHRFANEREFFSISSGGGTKFIPAYKMTREIAEKEFPAVNWNRYIFQGTDGDVWSEEEDQIPKWVKSFLDEKGGFNHFFYLETPTSYSRASSWEKGGRAIASISQPLKQQIGMARAVDRKDLTKAFKELFKIRKGA